MLNSLGTVLDPKKSKAKYPEARVIVLDDNFNTFQHVANCLLTIIPSMSEKRAWDLTCLLYTSPSPRDVRSSRMPSSA